PENGEPCSVRSRVSRRPTRLLKDHGSLHYLLKLSSLAKTITTNTPNPRKEHRRRARFADSFPVFRVFRGSHLRQFLRPTLLRFDENPKTFRIPRRNWRAHFDCIMQATDMKPQRPF